jgi:hypothetical protein
MLIAVWLSLVGSLGLARDPWRQPDEIGSIAIEQLRQRLGVKDGPFPYFGALLRSDRIGGATPQLSIVDTRVIHPSN